VSKATSQDIKKQAISEGMTTMLEDGLDKVFLGQTTLEEILRATKE
jgi:type II secretory ATPase GspE/PulE/Tfp pilus assembly ATPase PilB-like protein